MVRKLAEEDPDEYDNKDNTGKVLFGYLYPTCGLDETRKNYKRI